MTFWTPENFRTVTAGAWLRRPDAQSKTPQELAGLSTDSRAIREGQVFLALRGAQFDGHDFLARAAAAGASLLIVDHADAVPSELLRAPNAPAILRVRDTLRALGALAAAYRRTLEAVRVIAVCGANGKTTTTGLIHSLLSVRFRGSANPKSFNNEIGVPLTILAAKPSDQYLVCEVGTNAPGEIARLAAIVQPDIAVITSVGRAHIEFFDSLDAVVQEDAAIFIDLRPNGTAIIPAEDARLADLTKPVPHVVTFGASPTADLRLTTAQHAKLSDGRQGVQFSVNDRSQFELPLLGEHNALNALAAIAVARRLAMDDASIAKGLLTATAADMRLNHRTAAVGSAGGTLNLLIDCYNANPESAESAIRTFADLSKNARRRVLILGDMLELGTHAEACHRELAQVIQNACRAELVVTVGPHSLHIAETLSQVWTDTKFIMLSELSEDQARRIAARLAPGDFVLLKGSRGMKLERIVHALDASASSDRAATSSAPRASGPSPAQSVA